MNKQILKSLVTKIGQIVGGQTYIQVRCLPGEIWSGIITVTGKPFLPQSESLRRERHWFVGHRKWGSHLEGFYKSELSLDDFNMIPNGYNNHSLWRYTSGTAAWIESVVARGQEGIDEYLAVLSSLGRGKSAR